MTTSNYIGTGGYFDGGSGRRSEDFDATGKDAVARLFFQPF